MDCCGGTVSRRNWLWGTIATSAASLVAGCAAQRGDGSAAAAPDATASAVQAVLRDYISVDVHSHAGATGVTARGVQPNGDLARGMRAGGMATVCLADVPDGPLLGRRANGSLGVTRPHLVAQVSIGGSANLRGRGIIRKSRRLEALRYSRLEICATLAKRFRGSMRDLFRGIFLSGSRSSNRCFRLQQARVNQTGPTLLL